MMNISGFRPLSMLLSLMVESLTQSRGDEEHEGVAYPVHRQEQGHDEDYDQYQLRARVEPVYHGVAGEVLAEGDVLEHRPVPPS